MQKESRSYGVNAGYPFVVIIEKRDEDFRYWEEVDYPYHPHNRQDWGGETIVEAKLNGKG